MNGPPAVAQVTPRVHSVRRVLRNTLALAIGRNLIALARLALLAIVARGLGTDVFGQYALLIALLMIAEGLLDFGSNEIFVREVTSNQARRTHLLRVLTAGRLLHAPLAWAMLVVAALLLGYDRAIVQAAAVGGISLLFFGGVMVYRVVFRTELTMEREIVADFVSVIAMLAGVLWVSTQGGGIVAVMACHAVSRAVYFAAATWLGRSDFRYSIAGVCWADLVWSWKACAAVGTAGFMVMMYDPLDVLMLSRLASFEDTARFAAAQRLAWPLLITLASVSGTLYSVAAGAWPHDMPRLERACQRGLDAVVVAGLAVVSGAIAGAEFLLSLIGTELSNGAPAFGVLVVLCVVKSISSTVGPLLLVVGAQRMALVIVGNALVFKLVAGMAVIPAHGFVGLAWSALAVEVFFVAIPALFLVRRLVCIKLQYGTALRAAAICLVSVLVTQAWLGPHGLWPALLAPALYLSLALATRTLRLSELNQLRQPKQHEDAR